MNYTERESTTTIQHREWRPATSRLQCILTLQRNEQASSSNSARATNTPHIHTRLRYRYASATNTPQIQTRLRYKHTSATKNAPQRQECLGYKHASDTNMPRLQTRLTMMRSHGLEMAAPMAPDTSPANSCELKLSVPAPCGVSCRLKTSYSPIFEQLYVAARKIYGQSRIGNMSVPKL